MKDQLWFEAAALAAVLLLSVVSEVSSERQLEPQSARVTLAPDSKDPSHSNQAVSPSSDAAADASPQKSHL